MPLVLDDLHMYELGCLCIEGPHSDSRLILNQEGDVHSLNICHSEERSHCTLAGLNFILQGLGGPLTLLETLLVEGRPESIAAELADVMIVLL